ncbi:MAG: hypothetical protein QNJ62_04680 [Methyloceanibacter sp.]|nr:hypothetical protein [Methyloceanibacter sp.]
MIKITLVHDRPFWRMKGWSGAVTFALHLCLEVRGTVYETARRRQLTAFLGGPIAREHVCPARKERDRLLLGDLRRAVGDPACSPTQVHESLSIDNTWSCGGYDARVRQGDLPDAAGRQDEWSGPVRFARAEFDDAFAGYGERATQSGCRVAVEVAAGRAAKGPSL